MKVYEEILSLMQQRYEELAGFPADDASDIGIRLKVLAQQVYELGGEAEWLRQQVFPQTSTGVYLDMHAETRGLVRKAAQPAQGTLRFSRQSAAANDMVIPAGVLCSTRPDPQVQFETAQSATLPAGQTALDVPARAVDAGRAGNVAAGSVCLMITPAPGFTSVTNPAAFAGGVDEESDEHLRARLLTSYRNISNGTNSAFYYDLAMKQEGVLSANVLPRWRGRGTVDVVLGCASEEGRDAIAAALQQELGERKEINVDVTVRPAVSHPTDVTVEIAPREGCDFPLLAEACKQALLSHIEGLGVGAPLLLAQAGRELLGVEGVYNYRILAPSADAFPASDHIITPGALSVLRMVLP